MAPRPPAADRDGQWWSEDARRARLTMLRRDARGPLPNLSEPLVRAEDLRGQIENFIGVVRVPVGVAGPLALRTPDGAGTYQVPLATTEGTLVLAVTRGARAITASGGADTRVTPPQVTRAPLFVFRTGREAQAAAAWVDAHRGAVRRRADATTRHGRLQDVHPLVYGRRLVLELAFAAGDAAGQNMVTLAADAVCSWLRIQPPFEAVEFFTIESSVSLDKKSAAMNPARRRGRCAEAEVVLPADVVQQLLKTDPEPMARVAREGVYGCALAGTVGAQGQFANVLAALFLATGQDVATIAECGTGLTVMEVVQGGGLYASVTVPHLVLGTVGGGTRLPSQAECLEILGCSGAARADTLAAVAAAAVLAGELGLVAALANDSFARAHAAFGRPRASRPSQEGEAA